MARPRKEKASAKTTVLQAAFDLDDIADEVSEQLDFLPVNLNRSKMIEDALPTGLLSVDLISGGGFNPGTLTTIRGETGSGKSSLAYTSIKNSTDWGLPVFFLDYEGSTSGTLLESIVGRPLSEIIGIKNAKGKGWEVAPLIRYYQPTVGEAGFRFIHRILKQLPRKIHKDGNWYLVYSNDWKKDIIAKGLEYTQKKQNLFVKVPNGKAQALLFLDSYASMLPEARDENDEASPMAKAARMFSENIPMIKTSLSPKRVTVVATNQMRLKPMAMGDPRYEPGGQALGFYPDVVFDMMPVSPSTIKETTGERKGRILIEKCWNGKGNDRYLFSRIKTIKNKGYSPFRETIVKVWFEHKGNPKGGFCPVYDLLQYLRMTGQIDEGKYMKITLPGPWTATEFDYLEFKRLILDPDKYGMFKEWELKDPDVSALRKEIKLAKKDSLKEKLQKKLRKLIEQKMDIIQVCKNQLADGSAFKLYASTLSGEGEVEAEDSEESDEGSTSMDD